MKYVCFLNILSWQRNSSGRESSRRIPDFGRRMAQLPPRLSVGLQSGWIGQLQHEHDDGGYRFLRLDRIGVWPEDRTGTNRPQPRQSNWRWLSSLLVRRQPMRWRRSEGRREILWNMSRRRDQAISNSDVVYYYFCYVNRKSSSADPYLPTNERRSTSACLWCYIF